MTKIGKTTEKIMIVQLMTMKNVFGREKSIIEASLELNAINFPIGFKSKKLSFFLKILLINCLKVSQVVFEMKYAKQKAENIIKSEIIPTNIIRVIKQKWLSYFQLSSTQIPNNIFTPKTKKLLPNKKEITTIKKYNPPLLI